jgi:DNA-binding response OmpR family regulator
MSDSDSSKSSGANSPSPSAPSPSASWKSPSPSGKSPRQRGTGPQPALGGEVLLFDKDERVREGMRKLFQTSGLLVTAMEDAEKMFALVAQKHFAVAVLDADTPQLEEGLQILSRLKGISPATATVLLVNRQTFDQAVRGYRAGAVEVVAKVPECVRGLTERVKALCVEAVRAESRDQLLREMLEVHEQFLKKLIDASRHAQQAEDVAQGQTGRWELNECVILVVDENERTAPGLQEALGRERGYRCLAAVNGGEALDYAARGFQIALINEHISDLPWRTVVNSLRRQSSDAIVLLFTEPAQGPGKLSIIEESQTIDVVLQLDTGAQLVDAIHKMREAYVAKNRERHYLQAFRKENYDFLKRYVELRQRLAALLPPTGGVK